MAAGDKHIRYYYGEPYETVTVIDKIPLSECMGNGEFLEVEKEIVTQHPDIFGVRNLQGYGVFKARLKRIYISNPPVLKPSGKAFMNLSIMPPRGMKFYFTGYPESIYKLTDFEWSSDFGFYFNRTDGQPMTTEEIVLYQKVPTIYIINGLSR